MNPSLMFMFSFLLEIFTSLFFVTMTDDLMKGEW